VGKEGKEESPTGMDRYWLADAEEPRQLACEPMTAHADPRMLWVYEVCAWMYASGSDEDEDEDVVDLAEEFAEMRKQHEDLLEQYVALAAKCEELKHVFRLCDEHRKRQSNTLATMFTTWQSGKKSGQWRPQRRPPPMTAMTSMSPMPIMSSWSKPCSS
jgi:hypothetical protein